MNNINTRARFQKNEWQSRQSTPELLSVAAAPSQQRIESSQLSQSDRRDRLRHRIIEPQQCYVICSRASPKTVNADGLERLRERPIIGETHSAFPGAKD